MANAINSQRDQTNGDFYGDYLDEVKIELPQYRTTLDAARNDSACQKILAALDIVLAVGLILGAVFGLRAMVINGYSVKAIALTATAFAVSYLALCITNNLIYYWRPIVDLGARGGYSLPNYGAPVFALIATPFLPLRAIFRGYIARKTIEEMNRINDELKAMIARNQYLTPGSTSKPEVIRAMNPKLLDDFRFAYEGLITLQQQYQQALHSYTAPVPS